MSLLHISVSHDKGQQAKLSRGFKHPYQFITFPLDDRFLLEPAF